MHQRACREASVMARSSAFGAFSCMSDLVSLQIPLPARLRSQEVQVRQDEITSLYSETKRLRGTTYGPRPILTGSAVLLYFCGRQTAVSSIFNPEIIRKSWLTLLA